jgi:hypothetical protein
MTTPARPPSLSLRLGQGLVAFSVLTLLAVLPCSAKLGAGDFPCSTMPTFYVYEDTRLAYCIDWYIRWAYGGGAYAVGAQPQELLDLPPHEGVPFHVTIQRQGDLLLVNGHTLAVGQSYEDDHRSVSLNPWMAATSHLEVTNDGSAASFPVLIAEIPVDAVYMSGEVRESWAISPVGPLLLVMGVALLIREGRQTAEAA